MTRIVVSLDKDERRALDRLAMHELRDPRLQVRYLVRHELERLGLLQSAEELKQDITPKGESHAVTA